MAHDDADNFEDETGPIGSESWRRRFFRDLRLTVRDEVEKSGEALRTEFRSSLDALRTTRGADTMEALRAALEIEPDDMPEVRSLVQDNLRARRRHHAWREKFGSTVNDGLWKLFSSLLVAAIAGAALTVGSHYLPASFMALWGKG